MATYHLVDTSLTSPIRTEGYIEDNKRLNSNGGNLAAVLYRYKRTNEKVYRRIRSTVRKIVPSFDDFVLEPRELNPRNILLNWRQLGQDYLFGPHQFSDGALRAIALITVFQQPEDETPNLIVVDEPELGLHPACHADYLRPDAGGIVPHSSSAGDPIADFSRSLHSGRGDRRGAEGACIPLPAIDCRGTAGVVAAVQPG